jgi:hypothetical protein
MGVNIHEHAAAVGRLVFRVYRPDGTVRDERRASNLMCVAGTTALASAINWSMAQDQNAAMGSPLSPANLYPIYGAVGSSTTAATVYDTQLGAELGRSVVSEATTSAGTVLLFFFFGTTASTWTVTEAGVFVSGTATATATANTGLLLDHTVFTAVTKTASETATAAFTFDF